MPIQTFSDVRHEVSNNGNINLPMAKAMLRVLVGTIERQERTINNQMLLLAEVRLALINKKILK